MDFGNRPRSRLAGPTPLAGADKARGALMSAIGPKRTWPLAVHMSAFAVAIGCKADIDYCGAYVCF